MAHEVFICHASEDRASVIAIADGLEASGVKCWYSSRDIKIGQKWYDAVPAAMEQSQVVLLVWSSNANTSTPVSNELDLNLEYNIPVVTIRIDKEPINRQKKLLTGTRQWQEAYDPPLQKHLPKLIDDIKSLIQEQIEAVERQRKAAEKAAREQAEREAAAEKKTKDDAEKSRLKTEGDTKEQERLKQEARERERLAVEEAEKEKTLHEATLAEANRRAEEAKKAREDALKSKREVEEARKEVVEAQKAREEAKKQIEKAQKEKTLHETQLKKLETQKSGTAPRGKRRLAPVIWGLAAVIIVAGIGFGVWSFLKQQTPITPTETTAVSEPTITATASPTPATSNATLNALEFTLDNNVLQNIVVEDTAPFTVNVTGKISLNSDISFSLQELKLTFRVTGTSLVGGHETILNPEFIYSANELPKHQGEFVDINVPVPLQFPEDSQLGYHRIKLTLLNAQANIGFWVDIKQNLKDEYSLGLVSYLNPALYCYIEGYVKDRETKEPIKGATITFFTGQSPFTGAVTPSVVSDIQGYYRTSAILHPIPAYIEVSLNGYITTYNTNVLSLSAAPPVTFTSSGETKQIDFLLYKASSVSGKIVSDEDGAGIYNVDVGACDYTTGAWIAGTRSNTDGTYKISNIPAGTYYVLVNPANLGYPYANEYYNDVFSPVLAEKLVLNSGKQLSDIDISLAPEATVTGKVVADIGGKAIQGVTISVGTMNYGVSAVTGADGTYTVHNVPPGVYNIMAIPPANSNYAQEFWDNTTNYFRKTVTIGTSQQVKGIDFSLAPGGSISGKVVSASGSIPLANVSVEFYLYVDGGNTGSYWTTTDAQGNYACSGLPYGTYVVGAPSMSKLGSGDGSYMTEYYPEKTSQAQGTLVRVASGINPGNINFTISTGYSISGRITSAATGEGVINIVVNAINVTTGQTVSFDGTSADGTFTITGLPAGTYYIYADGMVWNGNYNSRYYPNAFDTSTAISVQIINGNVTNINISLTPK